MLRLVWVLRLWRKSWRVVIPVFFLWCSLLWQYMMVLTFEPVDEIVKCDHFNERPGNYFTWYSSFMMYMIFATSMVEQGPTAIHSSVFLLCLLRCLFRYKHWHYFVLTLKRNPQVGLFKRSSFEPLGSWKKSMLCWLSSAFLWRFPAAYGHVWKNSFCNMILH